MIISIAFDDAFGVLSSETTHDLDRDVLRLYPYPLSVSYRNLVTADDPVAAIGVCLKDTCCTLFQYLSLVALQAYASADIPRSYRVYTAIEQMVYRPGLGKWLGFLRELREHCRSLEMEPVGPHLSAFLDRHTGKRSTRLRLDYGERVVTLPTLDALVALRNRWAHSKHMTPDAARQLAESLLTVMRCLYHDMSFLTDCPLCLTLPGHEAIQLAGVELPTLSREEVTQSEVLLGLPAGNHPLMKLFLHWDVAKGKAELLLFEELVEQRRATYSSSFHAKTFSFAKQTEQPVVESVVGLLERVRSEDPILTLDRTTFDTLQERCNDFTAQICTDFVEAGRYDPGLYIAPDPLSRTLADFLGSPVPIYCIAGDQGVGKSALACHWARQLLGLETPQHEPPDHPCGVFLIEAHHFNARNDPTDLPASAIKDALHLCPETDLLAYLEKALADAPADARFVFIIDAVNEFESMSTPGASWGRIRLIHESLRFVERFQNHPSLRERVKLILTLRWDMLALDGMSSDRFEQEQASWHLFLHAK